MWTDHVCRFCRSRHGAVVLNLGEQPACDYFPPATEKATDPRYPLRLGLCQNCGLAQLLADPTTAEEPKGIEPAALQQQARDAIQYVTAAGLLHPGMRIAEYGSPHGGSWLPLLAQQGLHPVTNPAESAQVIIDCFGLMHHADQKAALTDRIQRLTPDGIFLIQYHSLATIIRSGQWNAIRHGHYAYYSTPVLVEMLQTQGMYPFAAWSFDLYGGTVLLAAKKTQTDPSQDLRAVLTDEQLLDLANPATAMSLQRQVQKTAVALHEWLTEQHVAGNTVLGYGAASRAVALLHIAGISPELLPAIADAAPAKHGLRIPGCGIPIISPAQLVTDRPDKVLLFVPDLLTEVRIAIPEIEKSGANWVIAEPLPVELKVKT